MLLVAGLVSPVYAQEAAGATGTALVQWSIITAGFALAIAAAGGALGQGRAVSSATEAIARNPGAAGEIRGALILGLVLSMYTAIFCARVVFDTPQRAVTPGQAVVFYDGDDQDSRAGTLGYVYGIALDADGNLYVADNGNSCVRDAVICRWTTC